jgi:cyclopropane-fatty-acyl-phospholipid synthase
MFEHMRNHEALLAKIARWMKPAARLFVHIFGHRELLYLFEAKGEWDWMARHFFTGGMMPSAALLAGCQRDLHLAGQWRVDGTHYQRTCEAWLSRMDAHRTEIMPLFSEVYGREGTMKWWVYWRVFFMSCAELWGYRGGQEWLVSHYLFRRRR